MVARPVLPEMPGLRFPNVCVLPPYLIGAYILIRTGTIMAKCSVCGKGPQFGHNRSHSMRATNRMFKPNVFKRRMVIDGEIKKISICTRCLRTAVKPPRK